MSSIYIYYYFMFKCEYLHWLNAFKISLIKGIFLINNGFYMIPFVKYIQILNWKYITILHF